ncbi:MAG: protein kinase [Pseudomonadota bacterium]
MDGDLLLADGRFEYVYGDNQIVLNTARRQLLIDGSPVQLEPKPLASLVQLMHSPRALQPFQYGLTPDEARKVGQWIHKVRKALGQRYKALIQNKRGEGYVFDGEIQRRVLDQVLPSTRLSCGDRVGDCLLEMALAARDGVEVWRARLDEAVVVAKVATDGQGARRLVREYSFWQLIATQVPDHAALSPPLHAQFDDPYQHLLFSDQGQDLLTWQLCASEPWTMQGKLDLATQLLEAVVALHGTGVIHGDLKPANILIARDHGCTWRLRLTDLGCARKRYEEVFAENNLRPIGLTMSEQDLTADGGTPLYVAPECLRSGPSAVGDVFALGVVLYQLFAGDFRRPFATGWQREVDDLALRELIARATEGDPARRYGSVQEMLNALCQLGERTREIRALARYERLRQRRPWIVALLVALALGTVFSAAFAWHAQRMQRAADTERAINSQATDFLVEFLRAAGDPRTETGAAYEALAKALDRVSASLDREEPEDLRIRVAINAALVEIYDGHKRLEELFRERRRTVSLMRALHGPASEQALGSAYRLAERLASNQHADEAIEVMANTEHTQIVDPSAAARLDRLAAFAHARIHAAHLKFRDVVSTLEGAVQSYRLRGDVDADYHGIMSAYAESLSRTGALELALEALRELDRVRARNGLDVPLWQRLASDGQKGQILGMLGRQDEAIAQLQPVLSDTTKMYGLHSARTAWVHATLAQQFNAIGQREAALTHYLAAREGFCTGEMTPYCAYVGGNLGNLLYLMGRAEEALAHLDVTQAYFDSVTPAPMPAIALFSYYYANALLELRRPAQARSYLDILRVEWLEAAAPGALWALRLRLLVARLALYEGGGDLAQFELAANELAQEVEPSEIERLAMVPAELLP